MRRTMLRKVARPVLDIPRVHYLKRALRVHLLHFTDDYAPEWRADRTPLMEDGERYAGLFTGSEERFEALVTPWLSEFDWSVGRAYNGAFQSVDAEAYHAMIRTHRPGLIIEVGGGHSTAFAHDALSRNGSGRLVCIDPDPFYRVPRDVEHRAQRIQEVDPALFEELGAGDILFIDSSHTTEEARYHVEQVLGRLRPGVLVHHHDFLYPYRAPWGSDGTMDEQGVLLDFYASHTGKDEVLFGSAYLVRHHPHLVRRLIRSSRWAPVVIPSSLWCRVRG